tara:strand:- start:103 stop:348 length:246 start_codon:yes stop_codon:yes gene_type:complete
VRYILFTREECTFCIKAITLLEEKKLRYSIINFDFDQIDILNEIKKAYDWKTVPMIFAREENQIEFIGGFSDLKERLDSDG